ncbi:MAG TPA: helix-turn-helix domain-containing protein [Geodermatophilus sp.]|nr:helix-turn-helix domain-containing protein [Geodermatophilus sp.]
MTATGPRAGCSIAAALGVLGDRWTLLVVRELLYGAHRYGEIAEGTGAATDVLAARLKRLVDAGVVERRPYSERPPRSEYHLTEAGRELAPVLVLLLGWGDRWANDQVPVVLEHAPEGEQAHPVLAHVTCAACGHDLGGSPLSARTRDGGVLVLDT